MAPQLNATATDAAVTAAGMMTITGGILGMQFDALVMGFLGGLIALSFQERQQGYLRMLSSVFSASILAGFGAPICVAIILHWVAFLSTVQDVALRCACAGGIGLVAQNIVPAILERLKNFIATFRAGSQ